MVTSTVLVLFDIDGTLIHTAGAGVRGMNAAFERLHGRSGALDGVPVAGRTDRAIIREVFRNWNVEMSDVELSPLRDEYVVELERELARSGAPDFGVLPGVHEALAGLEADPGFTLGLLTGNFVRGAEIKLAHFDLWRRFAFGAFGDHHVDRRDLVPVALARAQEHGVSPSHVVVIGDTPLDVDCAHAHGAQAVAVATGNYSAADLSAAGANLVVDTLEALDPIALRIGALCATPR